MEPTQQTNITPSQNKNSGMLWGVIGLIVIIAAVFGVMKYGKTNTQEDTNTQNTPATLPPEKKYVYTNGTYTAVGDYISPGGAETINITLVIENDVVTDATAIPQATRPISVTMQSAFVGGFKELIVGKNVDEITIDKVSGSSLTPKGFMDALVKIKAQAKA